MIDFAETIGVVRGPALEALNSLVNLANALSGDASHSQAVATATGNKADKSTTYTKTQTGAPLDAKVEDLQQNRHRS